MSSTRTIRGAHAAVVWAISLALAVAAALLVKAAISEAFATVSATLSHLGTGYWV